MHDCNRKHRIYKQMLFKLLFRMRTYFAPFNCFFAHNFLLILPFYRIITLPNFM